MDFLQWLFTAQIPIAGSALHLREARPVALVAEPADAAAVAA